MMKISAYIAVSLDGFIARKNGNIDWLTEIDNLDSFEDYGYDEFYQTIDCLIMGSNSFTSIIKYEPWPYADKKVFVLSHAINEVAPQDVDKYEIYSGSISALITKLQKQGYDHISIDGGQTIQSFINEGLINELTITTIPILLGEGIPLFGKVANDIKLKLVESKAYENGYVKNSYQF